MNMARKRKPSTEAGDERKQIGLVRDRLGIAVFGVSAMSILASGMILVFSTADYSEKEKVFSALVPLFGTWVGTILAFYFSRENFESARQSLENVVERLTPEQRLQQTPVAEAMTPAARIQGITLPASGDESEIPLKALLSIIEKSFTRVPIFNSNKSGRYVIHQSLFYKFVALNELKDQDFDIAAKTLKDMIQDEDIKGQITSIAWVRRDATLAEAKARMEELEQCQDAFVTQTGQETERVLGWVTNIDIQKRSRA